MEITRLAKSCFKIKGKKAIILIEPSAEIKNLTSHIVIVSSSAIHDFSYDSADPGSAIKVKGEPVVIFGPGEYEIKEVTILGIKEKGKTVYKIKMDGLSLLYLDQLQEKMTEEKVEVLNQVDILFLPVGRAKTASVLISQLEPLIIIPIEEKGIEEFLEEEGMGQADKLRKLIVNKEELPEERKIVILR